MYTDIVWVEYMCLWSWSFCSLWMFWYIKMEYYYCLITYRPVFVLKLSVFMVD